MKKMNFIRSLTPKKKPVVESVSFEDALVAQLERKVNKLAESDNPKDVVRLDVPLFIRLLEYAREDAKTDMDLHAVTEKIIAMSSTGETLTMDQYDGIVGDSEQAALPAPKEEALDLNMIRSLAGLK
jgi:cob(I)alamin adenosyltransferase